MSIKKHIPNAITSLNLICGVIGIIALFEPELHAIAYFPFLCMLTAVLFDFCDGLAARLLGAYSPLGKELDSLADMVSFGVLPALMMYFNCSLWAAGGIVVFFAWIPLLIAVFSAVRLAKFNLDERQHSSFIGLPTPASALICGSLCCLLGYLPDSFGTAIPWILIGVSLVLCVLLVCELPMFSFKFGKDIEADTATKMLRYALLSISFIIIVLVILFALPWPAIILGIFLVYILENALFRLLAPNKA